MRKVFNFKTVFLLCFLFLVPLVVDAYETRTDLPKELKELYQSAEEAYASGDYHAAVEFARRYIFLDAGNLDVQYFLGQALEAKGENKKAYKEYQIFLRLVSKDKDPLSEEQEQKVAHAESFNVDTKKKEKKASLLSFYDWNILTLTLLLTLTFLYRLGSWWMRRDSEEGMEEQAIEKLFVDKYWKKDKNAELGNTGIPQRLFTLIMFVLMIFFYYLSYRILFV